MLGIKERDIGVLQKHVHGRYSFHKREQHKLAQFDEDATELAYLVGQGAKNANWLPSQILVNLGQVEVLETATRGDRPKGCNATCSNAAKDLQEILLMAILHIESLLG